MPTMWGSMMDNEPVSYYIVAAETYLVTGFIFWLSDYVLLLALPNHYAKLTRAKQLDWRTRITSNIHAVIVSYLAIYSLLFDPSDDYVWGHTATPNVACAIVAGYLCADLTILFYYHKELFDMASVFHHVMSISAYLVVINVYVFERFAMWRLLAEISTVNVNMRSVLADAGLKNTNAYFYNGICVMVLFSLCRIAVMPVFYYLVYLVYGTPAWITAGHYVWAIYFCCFGLDSLNLFWFHKIMTGGIKAIRLHYAMEHKKKMS